MKYLIMVYLTPKLRDVWENWTPEERTVAARGHVDMVEKLTATGELIVSEPLESAENGKRIALHDGQVTATDGPFAEVKEHLAGFYLVECASEERAIEIAGEMPEADWGLVELRPIRDLSAVGL